MTLQVTRRLYKRDIYRQYEVVNTILYNRINCHNYYLTHGSDMGHLDDMKVTKLHAVINNEYHEYCINDIRTMHVLLWRRITLYVLESEREKEREK